MPFKGKVCSKGIWDESVPGIIFEETGKSNYALLHEKLMEAYPRGGKGKQEWQSLVTRIKEEGKSKQYDCIIGISGGTDSCYLLHLAKENGLRPLAVNLDNGWNSDIAVKNIKKITSALNIDLETYVIDYEEIKDLIKCYMKAGLPWIDMPTDLAIKSILYKMAAREGVRYILRGNDFRSEGSQPTEWTYGDGRQLKALHRRYGKVKLRTYPNYTLWNLLYFGIIRKIKSIYPFYYLDYNKNEAQQFLSAKYGWEYYGGHHYENIFTRFVMSYWLFEKFGIDKRKITLSAQVLSGEISREKALAAITELPYIKNDEQNMIGYVCKKLDLSRTEFDQFFNAPNKTYKDYPSYSFFFTRITGFMKPIIRLLFLHKPQSVYKSEVIDKKE